MDEHFINQAVIAGLLGRHKVIPLRIPLNGFQRLARHLAEHPVHPLFGAQDIFGVDFDIRGLALYAAVTPAADIMGARQVLVITDFGGKDDENAGPSDESQEPENDDGADAGEEE